MNDDDSFGNFISGFVSGEGSFYVSARTQPRPQVQCGFSIRVRADDRELIESIWRAMDFPGEVYDVPTQRYRYDWDSVKRRDAVMLLARRIGDLANRVVPFFDRYPLRGRKRYNYELWKQAVELVERGEHLTADGMEKILAIKAKLNRYSG